MYYMTFKSIITSWYHYTPLSLLWVIVTDYDILEAIKESKTVIEMLRAE